MSPPRLDDKYSLSVSRPDRITRDSELVALMEANDVRGSVFHVLNHTPEQAEDLYTVLVDDRLIVSLKVPRSAETPVVEELRSFPLRVYRDQIGQGKSRIHLDLATENARKLLQRFIPSLLIRYSTLYDRDIEGSLGRTLLEYQ